MNTKQKGAALIEFSLVLPLLLMLSFITTEFGRALYQYNTLVKSVRDAARYLSTQDPTILASDPGKVDNAKNLVVYGRFTNAGAPLALGLLKAQVPDPTWQLAAGPPPINTVTIKIAGCANSPPPCYKFIPLFNSVFGLTIGNINFADISATMRSPS